MDRATRQIRLRRFADATARAQDAYAEERRRRDDEIDAARAEGWSFREISAVTRLAPRTIEDIMIRAEQRRQSEQDGL